LRLAGQIIYQIIFCRLKMEGRKFLRNTANHIKICKVSQPRNCNLNSQGHENLKSRPKVLYIQEKKKFGAIDWKVYLNKV
jgi:hypothetical protein